MRVSTVLSMTSSRGDAESEHTWIEGIKQLVSTTLVLVLAWAIGDAMRAVGTDVYIASGVSDSVDKRAIPVLVFILSAFIAASTGTSWGTSAPPHPSSWPPHTPCCSRCGDDTLPTLAGKAGEGGVCA